MPHDISLTWENTHESLYREEWQLIEAAKKDLRCFEPLYLKYYGGIYGFVYKRIAEKEDVLDITSMVFEKAMSNLQQFKPQGHSFGSWLYRIALSECGNYYRRSGKIIKVSIDSDQLLELQSELDEPVYDKHEINRLLNAMQTLDEQEMQLLLLRYVEKIPYSDMSSILNCSENALRVKLHRIIEKLKRQFKR